MTASPPIAPIRLSPRAMAVALLLAWLPALLFVDHWPTPALLQTDTWTIHSHAGHSHAADGAAAHAEHGHGGAAEAAAGVAVVAPPVEVAPLHPPQLAEIGGALPMRPLTSDSPIPPPPR
ncbi:MAG: hypothetical protein OXI03_07680 [Chloroflexota bacterium]|nr:hypothetical protein [Chloroflexota bacterium]